MATILTLDVNDTPTHGDVPIYNDSDKTWRPGPQSGGGGGAPTGAAGGDLSGTYPNPTVRHEEAHTFTIAGTAYTVVGGHRLYIEEASVIESVRASVGDAPAGASLIVDVNRNGTTIYGTQANRPTITAGTTTDLGGTASNGTLAAGDYLTVDVDQIGTTAAGVDLTVTVRLRRN